MYKKLSMNINTIIDLLNDEQTFNDSLKLIEDIVVDTPDALID